MDSQPDKHVSRAPDERGKHAERDVLESLLVHDVHLVQLVERTFLERRLHEIQHVVDVVFLWSTGRSLASSRLHQQSERRTSRVEIVPSG